MRPEQYLVSDGGGSVGLDARVGGSVDTQPEHSITTMVTRFFSSRRKPQTADDMVDGSAKLNVS